MILYISYLTAILFILIFIMCVAIYMIGLIYSSIKGSPYVPTKRKILHKILKKAGLKKGHRFIDIGCGDGRVVEEAVVGFGAKATGIDINPLLIIQAKLRSKIKNFKANFIVGNIKDIDLTDYDVIYVFLMPEFIDKISDKLKGALLNKTTVISHGFKVKQLKKYLKIKIESRTFPTYIYSVI